MEKVTCILLAGGESSRMGSDKALLPFGSTTLLEHLVMRLQKMKQIEKIIICSNNPLHELGGTKRIKDLFQNCGPMGGIYTGLLESTSHYNWVLSCDTPFINEQLLIELLPYCATKDVVIPVFEGKAMYTMGLYTKKVLPQFLSHLQNIDLQLKKAVSLLSTHYAEMNQFDELLFANLNTFEDYQWALNKIQKNEGDN